MMLEYLILEMTMEMGFPLEIGIPRNPMGIGTKKINCYLEWEGVGMNVYGNGSDPCCHGKNFH